MNSSYTVAAACGITPRAGGLYYAVGALYRTLCAQGWSVSVFGDRASFSEQDRAFWDPVKVNPYKAFGPLRASYDLYPLLAASNADVVHQHGIWLADQKVCSAWGRKSGVPVVISPHGMLDSWALANSAWKKKLIAAWFANRSLNDATCIHALCQSELESVRAYGLRNPVAVIPNGVDLPDLSAASPPIRPEKRLLFMGRLHPKKGVSELIEAWKKCSGDWKLIIAGWDDGGHEETFRRQAKGSDSIEFAGPRFGEDKEALLRSVDAFILPSFSEGLPMTVLEAWSYGLPVLMTPFCNLPEGFKHQAAVKIEPDRDSIFQGLETVFAMSDEQRRSLGVNGRRLVEDNFTWSKIAEQMGKVYEWCLTGGDAPECMDFHNG